MTPIGMSTVIEMIMFTVALVVILVGRIKPSLVVEQPLLKAGFVPSSLKSWPLFRDSHSPNMFSEPPHSVQTLMPS